MQGWYVFIRVRVFYILVHDWSSHVSKHTCADWLWNFVQFPGKIVIPGRNRLLTKVFLSYMYNLVSKDEVNKYTTIQNTGNVLISLEPKLKRY